MSSFFHSLFDALNPSQAAPSSAKQDARERAVQHEMEQAILILTAAVIHSHKNCTSATELVVNQFFQKQFNSLHFGSYLKALQSLLTSGVQPLIKMNCEQLKGHTDLRSRAIILQYLFSVAASDDFVTAKEQNQLKRIATYLGLGDTEFKRIKTAFLRENNPYFVLEIEEEASIEEVKTAYRKMTLKHHPDRAKEGTQIEAEIRFRQIKFAFDTILKQRASSKGE